VKLPSVIVVCLLAAPAALAQIAEVKPAGYAPLAALPMSHEPAQRIHPAVVRIVAPGDGSISFGSGTLVYVGEHYGLVVTNWHVINEATGPISVHFPDGFYSLASIQKIDRDWDLAILAIRKPNVESVPLANQAPQPGEMLTIAGYGSGSYRAASGVCTQYVAPGTTFPFEMVEVAVSARQGDSGGPIFNSRGELAGVLFGEGNGRTSGSYCGRVRWFLASVAPGALDTTQQLAAARLAPIAPRPSVAAGRREPAYIASFAAGKELVRESSPPVLPAGAQSARTVTAAVPAVPRGVVASTRGCAPVAAAPQVIGWEDLAGETLGEQAKTVMAAIGVLAIILHALKWMSTEPAKA
jgi:hypothetical protein